MLGVSSASGLLNRFAGLARRPLVSGGLAANLHIELNKEAPQR
jgi:hypothetical protein